MKISASIFSNTTKSIHELVKELDAVHVDYLHVDCNDDLSVFDQIKEIRTLSETPIDLHIISADPEKFFSGIQENHVELVTFQYENLQSSFTVPANIKSKLGLAIVSETPVEVFEQFSKTFEFVLFMTTTPGKSGGVFNPENFRKIRKFKTLFPDKKIHVDGGVTDEVAFVLRNLGVFSIVSGSYLVNPKDTIGRALHRLKSESLMSHTGVAEFMLTKEELPLINSSASFIEILESIEKYNLGFTAVIDPVGKLSGIISNADVRRGLIRNHHQLNTIGVDQLINKEPYKIKLGDNVSEMLSFIKNIKATILFLPVVDQDNILHGVVTFNNLIKGE